MDILTIHNIDFTLSASDASHTGKFKVDCTQPNILIGTED